MTMKKFKMLAACLVLTLSLSALTACGTNRNNTNTNNNGKRPTSRQPVQKTVSMKTQITVSIIPKMV